MNYTHDTVTADCTVTVSFAINAYTVTPARAGRRSAEHGANGELPHNGTTSFHRDTGDRLPRLRRGGACGSTASGINNELHHRCGDRRLHGDGELCPEHLHRHAQRWRPVATSASTANGELLATALPVSA